MIEYYYKSRLMAIQYGGKNKKSKGDLFLYDDAEFVVISVVGDPENAKIGLLKKYEYERDKNMTFRIPITATRESFPEAKVFKKDIFNSALSDVLRSITDTSIAGGKSITYSSPNTALLAELLKFMASKGYRVSNPYSSRPNEQKYEFSIEIGWE